MVLVLVLVLAVTGVVAVVAILTSKNLDKKQSAVVLEFVL